MVPSLRACRPQLYAIAASRLFLKTPDPVPENRLRHIQQSANTLVLFRFQLQFQSRARDFGLVDLFFQRIRFFADQFQQV